MPHPLKGFHQRFWGPAATLRPVSHLKRRPAACALGCGGEAVVELTEGGQGRGAG